MRRWLFNFAAAVSLLLAITFAVEFVLSYWRMHAVAGFGQGYGYVATCKGSLLFGVASNPLVRMRWVSAPASQIILGRGVGGFHRQSDKFGRLFGFPLWLLAVAFAWIISRLRRSIRVRPPGLCPACGYDLCATPDRCPECGAVARPAATAA